MSIFFIRIYDFFANRKGLFYTLLVGSFILMAFFASRLKLQEDITSFFPDDTESTHNNALIFKNLKIKDRIIVMVSASDTMLDDPEELIAYAESFETALLQRFDSSLLHTLITTIDEDKIQNTIDFIYNHLPVYLDQADYLRIDSVMNQQAIDGLMKKNYDYMVSPMGIALKNVIVRDPIGMGGKTLSKLQQFNQFSNYELYESHIFAKDLKTLLLFIDPAISSSASSENERLIDAIEDAIDQVGKQSEGRAAIDYFGGSSIAVYNARQIKRDTMVTLNIALVLIIIFIMLAFRQKRTVFLVLLPVVFGALFALAIISLTKGEISSIAIGAGSAIMGIALSYSIHVLSHNQHSKDVRTVIEELAYPLTIGSFTTIGAFLGLLFTTSPLLRDFGLFSALLLIGTTLFCLIFLPHFLGTRSKKDSSRLMAYIERITSYSYDRKKWIVCSLIGLTGICLFYFNDVSFNYDMMRLNYEPEHLQRAEKKVSEISSGEMKSILFISAAAEPDSALSGYRRIAEILKEIHKNGQIDRFVTAADFLLPSDLQRQRIAIWNEYWTPQKKADAIRMIDLSAQKVGFNDSAFAPLKTLLNRDFLEIDLRPASMDSAALFSDWMNKAEGLTLLISQVSVPDEKKEEIYALLDKEPHLGIVDRSYFISKMARSVNKDFYTILGVSSVLIFLALLISYGRVELAVLAFVPMSLSWIIILGLMALFGIEFNIVNIILSTFIFGIGDDFSIFIMDGLLSEYRTGKKMLAVHKTAIFFSTIMIIVGMGVLVFAKHPAIKSLAVISLLGISAVVIISYTVQPVLFKFFISGQTKKGGAPFTFASFLNTVYSFLFFTIGCFVLQVYQLLLYLFPVAKKQRVAFLLKAMNGYVRLFLKLVLSVRFKWIGCLDEKFEKPAIIIANHQSFIDLLLALSLTPKIVVVTNTWVWKSPIFGRLVRHCGFLHAEEGPEMLLAKVRQRIHDGYSVLIFPEGTRSVDCEIKRFHKGAFLLASELNLDIVPLLFWGNGLISAKNHAFYIKRGETVTQILPRITPADPMRQYSLRDQAKIVRQYMQQEYAHMDAIYRSPDNPYFMNTLMKNYIYKGPVLEWYMRVKILMEDRYRFLNTIIPRNASIVDIGCGYAPLSLMLSLYSKERTILGIDYDCDKIEVANHSFLKDNVRMQFVCGDAVRYPYQSADVFIMNDMLHYIDSHSRETLITACAENLAPGGLIIIRDGDMDKREKHKLTQLSEKWSTRITGFNKTTGALHFFSAEWMMQLADKLNLNVEKVTNDRFTSNTFFLLTQKNKDNDTI